MLGHRLHREVAHVERVLDDEPVDVAVLERRRRASPTRRSRRSFTFLRGPTSCSAWSMPKVVDSFGVKMPLHAARLRLRARARRLSLFWNALSVVAPPYWLSLTTLTSGVAPSPRRGSPSRGSACSPIPPGSGGRRRCPSRRARFAIALAGELARRPGCRSRRSSRGRRPGDRSRRRRPGSSPAAAALTGARSALVVERREDDARDALRDERAARRRSAP